jgi:hypothetical protein
MHFHLSECSNHTLMNSSFTAGRVSKSVCNEDEEVIRIRIGEHKYVVFKKSPIEATSNSRHRLSDSIGDFGGSYQPHIAAPLLHN